MNASNWDGIPELLSRLEDLELPLLSWGVVDGYLSAHDVSRAIDTQSDLDAKRDPFAAPVSEADYLERLLSHGLLHQVRDLEPRYRTRLGETLRLLRTLRQLLPPTDEGQPGWWRHASSLVSD